MFGALGQIIFQVLDAPSGFESATTYDYAEHRVVESKPVLQWLADGLERIALEMFFHVSFAAPALQMDTLRSAAGDHQALPLVLGNGTHRGYFVITSITEIQRQLAADGSLIAVGARVGLKEWQPGTELSPFAPPKPVSPPIALAGVTATQPRLSPGAPGLVPSIAYQAPGVSPLLNNLQPRGPGGPDLLPQDVPPATIVRGA